MLTHKVTLDVLKRRPQAFGKATTARRCSDVVRWSTVQHPCVCVARGHSSPSTRPRPIARSHVHTLSRSPCSTGFWSWRLTPEIDNNLASTLPYRPTGPSDAVSRAAQRSLTKALMPFILIRLSNVCVVVRKLETPANLPKHVGQLEIVERR